MGEQIKNLGKQLMDLKFQYDSTVHAIKVAKQYGADEESNGMRSMIASKQTLKQKVNELSDKISKRLTSVNIINLEDCWVGVKTSNEKGEVSIKIDPVNPDDLHLIRRGDGKTISRQDLDTLLPGIIHGPSISIYKEKVSAEALSIVYSNTGLKIDPEDASAKALVTQHAGKRWVQRRKGIPNEIQAEEYRKNHLAEIEAEVLAGFENSQLVWRGTDDIAYYFDDDNVMYVVSPSKAIITLYEEDFGFSRAINRSIVISQLEELAKAYDNLKKAEQANSDSMLYLEGELQSITSNIKILESQIEALQAKKIALAATRDEGSKIIKVELEKFNAEFNKLFKRWEQ